MTKKQLAELLGVSPAAVGQYETGTSKPRPELIPTLAAALDQLPEFFLAGRPHGKVDSSMAHFRSLRKTPSFRRDQAATYAGQVWELAHALEKRIQLPLVDLPGFSGGEVHSGTELPSDPVEAARALRQRWGLGPGPVRHLVRVLESHGIIVVVPPQPDEGNATVDAFSTSRLPRPVVVLTANRADNVYRHRFTAAHELGHLVLHGDVAPGDRLQEREANIFAAEFLTPRNEILPLLPRRLDFARLAELQRQWGVSVSSLINRCRELELLSEATITRAYRRLHDLAEQPGFKAESASLYEGEQPVMLHRAFQLARTETGLSLADLASELVWKRSRVRELLAIPEDPRPVLKLVT
ncbi:ImmA/IrrE family metallo-endopeptidase [Nocardiopsis dassonvillei]|nr:ImmA/IrrE family metallo-endopeptidase [Nocardiopsis dassonvillei]